MKSPAEMETDFTKSVGLFAQREATSFQVPGNLALAKFFRLTAGVEGQRPLVKRHRNERDPGGGDAIARDRPVVLICVSRRDPAARLLVQRLVVI